MLPLSDPRWKELKGGYRVPYDASPALIRLARGENVWDELWQELHHQGDVDQASYAAVPHIVRIVGGVGQRDWNPYSLASVIEVERHRKSNPPIATWLADGYAGAWRELLNVALDDLRTVDDPETLRAILGTIALAKGSLKLGALLSKIDESELAEVLERYDAWSELYR